MPGYNRRETSTISTDRNFTNIEHNLVDGRKAVIKAADTTEIPTIEEMIRHSAINADGFAVDEFDEDGSFNHRLLHKPKAIVLKDSSSKILGAAVYGFSKLSRVPGSIFGSYFLVEKEKRRMGIGTLLLNTVTSIAKEVQCSTLVFDVYIDNHHAITWLNKYGFICTGSLSNSGYMVGKGFTDTLLFYKLIV